MEIYTLHHPGFISCLYNKDRIKATVNYVAIINLIAGPAKIYFSIHLCNVFIIVPKFELNVIQALRLARQNLYLKKLKTETVLFISFFILKNIPEFHFVVQVRPNSGHLAAQTDLLKNPQCHFC